MLRVTGCLTFAAYMAAACISAGGSDGGAPGDGGAGGGFVPYDAGCSAPGDGSRVLYSTPGPGVIWLADCGLQLSRDYWRVFQHDSSRAFTIPRVDTAPYLAEMCVDSPSLLPLLERYDLCPDPLGADINLVNNMLPEDALRITRALHERLKFRPGITPFPLPGDVLDACNLRPPGPMADICAFWKQRLVDGLSIGIEYKDAGADELVLRLNELYGIPP